MPGIVDKYMQMFAEMRDYDIHNDYESAHETEDEIYKEFITDITSGKLVKHRDILLIALAIKEFAVDYSETTTRWRA